MKNTSKFSKMLALVLCVAILALAVASCGKSKNVAMSYEMDGETYTLSEAEYAMLMIIMKQNLFSNYIYYGQYYGPADNAAFWNTKTDEGKTYEQLHTENALKIAKSVVVEAYLAKKYNLMDANGKLNFGSDEALKKEYETAVSEIATTVKSLGGTGAYRRYYGYMPAELENYYTFTYRSKLVLNSVFDEKPLTEEELEKYYTENFKQYIIIMINKEEDIKYEKDKDGEFVLDENGNKKPYYVVTDKTGSTKYVTDISEKYLKDNEYTLAYSYQYEKITDTARKDQKKELVDEILQKLKDGASFEELAMEYSDEMLTHYYKPGYMVDGDLINDKAVIDAIKDLEIGKYTEKAITVQSKYDYIIKRVDLTEKASTHADENAEDKTYAALFKDYVTAVETKTYSDKIEEMAKSVVVNTAVTSKYTMQGTYLSKMFGQ
jgi:hypothetical protein